MPIWAVSKYTDPAYRFDPASLEDQAAVDLIYERGLVGSGAGFVQSADGGEGDEATAPAVQDLLSQIIERTGIVQAGAAVPLAATEAAEARADATGEEPVQLASANGWSGLDLATIAPKLYTTLNTQDLSDAIVQPERREAFSGGTGLGETGVELAQLGRDKKPRPPRLRFKGPGWMGLLLEGLGLLDSYLKKGRR